MGRGDKKTKKGKTFKGSFGKTRTSKTSKKTAVKKGAQLQLVYKVNNV